MSAPQIFSFNVEWKPNMDYSESLLLQVDLTGLPLAGMRADQLLQFIVGSLKQNTKFSYLVPAYQDVPKMLSAKKMHVTLMNGNQILEIDDTMFSCTPWKAQPSVKCASMSRLLFDPKTTIQISLVVGSELPDWLKILIVVLIVVIVSLVIYRIFKRRGSKTPSKRT
jgi:hypothetical protein